MFSQLSYLKSIKSNKLHTDRQTHGSVRDQELPKEQQPGPRVVLSTGVTMMTINGTTYKL